MTTVKDVVRSKKLDERRERAEASRKLKVEGTVHGVRKTTRPLPPSGKIKRYVLTSAQNNTHLHEAVWESLTTLAKYYKAEILVGTFSYDQNLFRAMSVKRGKEKKKETEVWFDKRIEPFINDERVELASGLVWCGEMNILPTAVDPLSGLESYTARKSAIFPHAKLAMRSIPTMLSEDTKFNYTTGTVTKRNYVQKRAGLVAEHHHVYGGLLVEVNEDGHWWVRQLNADKEGKIQDLTVIADGKTITDDNAIEAITWGDLHGTMAQEDVVEASQEMLDELRPAYQFFHDLLQGVATNHRGHDNAHYKFYQWLQGLNRFDEELRRTIKLVERYHRLDTKAVAVDSNHDDKWIQRWLRDYDYRKDPANSELFLKAQTYLYAQIRAGKMPRDVNMLEWCLREVGLKMEVKFLVSDESYTICNKKIECGMHGHLGLSGSEGTTASLMKMGRKANTAHTHSAGIYNGLYVAGTSTVPRWTYNRGPSSWSHSHVATYSNGKRAIITMYKGRWRA